MKCPRCVEPVVLGAPQCVRCGFQLASLDEEFGDDFILLDRLTDAAHCLRANERTALEAVFDEFEKEFPQLFCAAYIGLLPELTSIRQFGFWLINHAAVAEVDISRPNEQGVFIVLDLQSRVLNVTLGYSVERFLSERDLEKCLKVARPHLFSSDYQRGLSVFMKRLSRVLRKRSRQAAKKPGRFAPPPPSPLGRPVFRKLRDHQEMGGSEETAPGHDGGPARDGTGGEGEI
ncbi:MAG: TPM domain-containing protein [Verrucomicrobiales bacterium]